MCNTKVSFTHWHFFSLTTNIKVLEGACCVGTIVLVSRHFQVTKSVRFRPEFFRLKRKTIIIIKMLKLLMLIDGILKML